MELCGEAWLVIIVTVISVSFCLIASVNQSI